MEIKRNKTVGNTPLVELKKIEEKVGFCGKIFAKVESFNPAGSVKDRIALSMIEGAEEEGKLVEGSVIIEPTSGNTGIGIAYIAKQKGYRAILTMPDSMSVERREMLKSYGAEIVLTPGKDGMKGAIAKAKELNEEIPHSLILGQFENPNNPKAHYEHTGPEIYKDLNGKIDIFVAGVGTGGTVSGVGRYLKEKNPSIKVVAVEPASSPVLSGGNPGPHKIQGIGAGFVPKTLDLSVVDQIMIVENEDAFAFGKMVRELDDISVGISSGAALNAAVRLAQQEENKGKTIVVLFPDGGDRYYSTALFDK